MKLSHGLLLAGIFLALNGALTYTLIQGGQNQPDPAYLRSVGSKLQGAGLDEEAATYYQSYLAQSASLSTNERSNIALAAGSLFMEAGRYKKALGLFYEIESLAPGSPAAKEASKKIVSALERSGNGAAARTAMASRTQLGPTRTQKKASSDDPIVAKTATLTVTRSEAEHLRATMPGASALDDATFLQQALARAALLEKAKAAGVAEDADVQQQIQLTTEEILISALAKVRGGSIRPPTDDILLDIFNQNAPRFEGKSFEDVKAQVAAIYAMNAQGALYQKLVEESFRGQNPEFFPERLRSGNPKKEDSP